jgi:hypothetical protein
MGMKLDILHWEEKHMLRLFDNNVLRIYGPKREGARRQLRRLHDEEF